MADPSNRELQSEFAEVIAMLTDPATSYWLRDAIVSAYQRDPFDAERDALMLARLLTRRLEAVVSQHSGG